MKDALELIGTLIGLLLIVASFIFFEAALNWLMSLFN